MQYVILAVIALLVLAAITLVAVGNRGWDWGTVTGAILVVLASVGYVVLVAMLAERENAWREKVRGYELQVAKSRDAMRDDGQGGLVPLGPCGVEALENCPIPQLDELRDRWRRQLERVESWRGLAWKDATFDPPTAEAAGSIRLPDTGKPSLAPGARIYVFDTKRASEGGVFVGGFRVTAIDGLVLTVEPLVPPDDKDLDRWKLPRETVLVLDSMPIDRWMAFHQTNLDAEGVAWPLERKAAVAEGTLRGDDLKNLELHETTTEQLAELEAAESATGAIEALRRSPEPPPGVRWAELTFREDFDYEWPDGTITSFKSGEQVEAFPAGELPKLRQGGAEFDLAWVIPPGAYWAEVEFNQAYTAGAEGGSPRQFEAGDEVEFDLAEAERLAGGDAPIVRITRRFFRRPLRDARMALEGANSIVEGSGGNEPKKVFENLDALGTYRRRTMLEARLDEAEAMTERLTTALGEEETQLGAMQGELQSLTADRDGSGGGGWKNDLATAEKVEAEIRRREAEVDERLRATEARIVALGRELRTMTGTLATEIDRRTPPPDRKPVATRP